MAVNNKIVETYLKYFEDGEVIVSFEGNEEDIERVRNFVEHMYDEPEMYECDNQEDNQEEEDLVNSPRHYNSGKIETIQKIDAIVDGLPAKEAYYLGNVIKYADRAGLKDDAEQDLAKASAYAYRLVYGHWRKDN